LLLIQGIRCERASALLGEKGLDNVYQMRGGIHRYLEEFPVDGGHWKGQNYTFDKRFAHGPQETVTLGHCAACEKPYDKYRGKKRCKCGVPLLICEDCQNLHPDTLCKLCKREMVTVNPKAFKKAIAKPKARTPDCGVCGLQFNSRNAMFKHLKESGHMDRKAKKRAA
jgi:predicted sulfurtransferase